MNKTKTQSGFTRHYFLKVFGDLRILVKSTALLPEIKSKRKNSAGFTLIELLVVIAIIGLLASVVLVAMSGARAKARDAKRVADLNQLMKAMELYFNDNATYPVANSSGLLSGETFTPPLTPTYLTIMPTTVTPPDGSCGSGGAGTNDYYYYSNVGGASYTITFCLGSKTGSLSAGVHTITQTGMQ